MAVALSKSMVDKEQEIDVDIALVSSEIASIDGQIQKLLRKKETLVKKLAKLEKARLKAAKSVVLAPDETKLFDLDKAFQVLFPPNLKAASFASSRRWMRSAVAIGAVAMYKPRYALPMNMWARAAQVIPSAMTEEQMYYNSVLRPFLPPSVVKQVEEATEAMTSDKSHKGHGMVGCAHNAMDAHAPGTPPSVHRVFPKWRENCEFMGTQSASQLEDALQELQKSMNDFAAEPEEELDGRDDPDSSAPAQRHDELDAYLHVKQVMLRLLHEKRRTAHEVAARVTSIDEANVLSTPEEPPEQQSNHTNADDTSGASTTASNRIDTSIISIQDSSDEGEDSKYSNSDVASDQEQIVGADEVVNPENACLHTGLVGGTAVTLASVGSGPPSIAPSATICADTDADDVRADSTMDDLLMRALQRNEQFYEQVLLLQPIDVDELFTYLTQCPEFTNGQRCTKSYLFPFLDRNGITFKTSGNLASSRRK
ncbi:TPA: hypothetical protein N0F65_000732 [Lagenidium giganteum]|uniref:Structure-specific endonuclease subunit SLX4 n=1 Tax=Lagenidium giganteum TaxID=4803 RepID=A0AAV2ZKS8_9STRA|nr:TPA: hypothetical protein N0F65_000732 [Lagenidium giganteum]